MQRQGNADIYQVLNLFRQGLEINNEAELETILDAQNRVAPQYIEELDQNEVFVFGSNVEGVHLWSASKLAYENFGAVLGCGEGLKNDSYALPSTAMKGNLPSRWKVRSKEKLAIDLKYRFRRFSIEELKPHVDKFIQCARENTDKTFYLTRVGCGVAFLEEADVAPLFKEALKLKNVYFPQSFLDVFFGVEPSFLNPSVMVPSTNEGISDFKNALEKQLSLYIKWLRIQFKYVKNNIRVITKVERICSELVKAIDLYFRGLPSSSFEHLISVLETDDLWEKALKPVVKGRSFYRMRVETDNWKKKEVNINGMFHIPFSMRDMVKTQRYSVPGYPCLYLGEHIFSCWEEMGRPNLDECLISRVENQQDFYVFDLSIPEENIWQNSLEELNTTIKLFPFIIACTVKTANQNATFKPEYIIPQIMLQCVKDLSFKKNRELNKDKRVVYGIKYTSVNITNARSDNPFMNFGFANDVYNNYVIPVIDIKHEYCKKLSDLFYITTPICEEFERVKNINPNMSPAADELTSKYNQSIFGNLEKALSEAELYKVQNPE